MAEPVGRTILVINGRVLEIPPSRTGYRTDPRAGWRALALLGGTLLGLGVAIAVGLGPVAAIGGVALFITTAVVAGSERYECATALGSAGVVWTSAGMAIYLGTDPSLELSALAFVAVGLLVITAGSMGFSRTRRHEPLPNGPI